MKQDTSTRQQRIAEVQVTPRRAIPDRRGGLMETLRRAPEQMIPTFVTNLLGVVPVPLSGEGGLVRDRLHVNDHRRGLDLPAFRACCGQQYGATRA